MKLLDPAVVGLLRPGVDGDVAGLALREDSVAEFITSLSVEATQEGLGFTQLSEAAFMDAIAVNAA